MRPFLSDAPRLFCIILLTVLGTLVLLDRGASLLLPPERLFFRGWEYVSGAGRYNIARRSLTHVQDEYGDLGNMLGVDRYKQWRRNAYTMDEEGYRNVHGKRRSDAPVVVVGDSFIAGVGNTDQETFAVELERLTGIPMESYVPGDLSLLLTENRFPDLRRGTLLVWGRVERNLTAGDGEIQKWMRDTSCFTETPWKRLIRTSKTFVKQRIGNWVEYANISPLRRIGQRAFQRIRFALTGGHANTVILSEDGSDMLFYSKDVRLLRQDAADRQIADVADAIAHAQDCLARRGLSLLFVPIPDKPHIEHAHVPEDRKPSMPLSPDPLSTLQKELSVRGVRVVDLLPAFQEYAGTTLLYWKDDTHWNGKGIRLAAEETAFLVADMLQDNQMLEE